MGARRHSPSWCCFALALCGFTPIARAQPAATSVHLSWVRDGEASQSCPDVATVQADVSRRLGFSPFAAEAPSASIEVLVARANGVWQASVAIREASGALRGSRRVESGATNCQSLASATSLAIALMIDPKLMTREPAPEPPPPVVPDAASSQVDHTPHLAVVEAPAPSARRGAVTVGASLAAGILPHPALAAMLQGEVGVGARWSLLLAARYFAEQRWTRGPTTGSAALSLASGGACYRVELGAQWALAGCGAALVGSLELGVASTEPIEPIEPGARLWLGASAGLRLTADVGPVELACGIDGLAHFDRRAYEVQRERPRRRDLLLRESNVAAMSSWTAGVRF